MTSLDWTPFIGRKNTLKPVQYLAVTPWLRRQNADEYIFLAARRFTVEGDQLLSEVSTVKTIASLTRAADQAFNATSARVSKKIRA
jgi:hypothetical protein